ncbi:NAD(P)-dependent dehydrogenase (short-subunit alcohol dehydrogenase family) [Agromyces sp. 3263]|uniref:SDR family NAD(P)-dependent oxidoreductase n=1 Tax=Agromyces sp. 3263 TaxID=2817750 RepID=UPI0028555F68|nr:SDR family NAD(P)-dependent oxidoreductase [Agromyces sp. 3263]MDR6906161.1 NAD(P)-dependent dehydrogenase (short-subunit alcohol dehydrogenase family) [Agromyces sp. 3263]
MTWYPLALPSLTGRRYLVTGANAGLGFFTAARLAGAGAHVVLSGRSPERLDAAAAAIRGARPAASVDTLVMDVSSLDAVADATGRLLAEAPLDGIVANAGIVHPPRHREESVDGNELVLATNVLGHFAMLGGLVRHLAPGARVVSLGSLATRLSTFRVDDLQLERGYDGWRAYAQSKIAAQSVGFELDRRLRAVGSSVASVVAHPGYSVSGRTPTVPGVNEPSRGGRFGDALQAAWAQGKHRGAEVVLHALTAADVEGGQFWGPRFLTRGEPTLQEPTRVSSDPAIGARVWAFAEQATGRPFVVGA